IVNGLTDLQMVTGNTLVEDRGQLAPGVELGDALGYRPPHTPGAREIIGRAGVIDAALVGGGDKALEGLDLVGDVELADRELGDGAITGGLHPFLQGGSAVQLARRVGVEM